MQQFTYSRNKGQFILTLCSILGILLSLFMIQGCQKQEKAKNFILITLDTQRADFISAYSSQYASTPNIDFLAQQGTLYENCYSLIPITLPSHASIFLSQPPYALKVYNNGHHLTEKRTKFSLANIFKKHGYLTAAFVSLGVLKSDFGLAKGFDLYQDQFPPGRWYLNAGEINEEVFPWLDKNKDQRFFAWIHYSDPHEPYAPPGMPLDLKISLNGQSVGEFCLSKYTTNEITLTLEKGQNQIKFEVNNPHSNNPENFQARLDMLDFYPLSDEKAIDIQMSKGWTSRKKKNTYLLKKQGFINIVNHSQSCQIKLSFRGKLIIPLERIRELYKREVEYLDSELGRLWNKLKELNLFQKSHILMVSDHGEGLGDYLNKNGSHHIGHIHYLYNSYLKVPLIIYDPQAKVKGVRVKELVNLLDTGPTIIDIMGFKKPSNFQGRNLMKLKEKENLVMFEETYAPEAIQDRFAVLHFPWHLIFTPDENRYELFNLKKDPKEKINIFKKNSLSPSMKRLKKQLDSYARQILKGKKEVKIDKKTEEMLRALGYIK